MPAVQKIGIVGSGIGGLTLAALLADAGLEAEVLEKAVGPSTLGSGITLQGNALRIFRELGIWDQLQGKGYPFNTLGLRTPDLEATVIAVLDDVHVGGEDLPATMGIPRRDLAAIVRGRAQKSGAVIRYGVTVTGLEQVDDAVTVTTATGETLTYDLLVGADGLNSSVRAAVGIPEKPRRTGMGIWRAFVPRPAEVTRSDLYYGGPAYIAGYTPTGPESMYAYLVEEAQERDVHEGPTIMGELAAAYGGPWHEIRQNLHQDANVNYTHFTTHLVEGPWHRGRVALLGDAVHSCPPTIAQGAAMAVEDAAVLADEIIRAPAFDEAVLTHYRDRRLPRAKIVVEASVQIGQWMLEGKKDADVPGLMHLVADTVKVPV